MPETDAKKRPAEDASNAAANGDGSNKKGRTKEPDVPKDDGKDSFVGLAFAKDFGDNSIYFGVIVEKFYDEKDKEWCSRVVYEDGDMEEYSEEEIEKGMALFLEKAGKGPDGPKISSQAWKFFDFASKRQKGFDSWKAKRNAALNGETNGGDGESEDKILKEYHFCNIYRELDRGTTFFHSQILDQWKAFVEKYPKDEERQTHLVEWIRIVLWSSFVYRQVNKVESFMKGDSKESTGIPSESEWPKFKESVQKIKEKGGEAFFTDAHINQGFDKFMANTDKVVKQKKKTPPCSKLDQTAQEILDNGVVHGKLEPCFNALLRLPGIGEFMAWQILCDLMESNCLPKCDSGDFCRLGPGARGTCGCLFHHLLYVVFSSTEANNWLLKLVFISCTTNPRRRGSRISDLCQGRRKIRLSLGRRAALPANGEDARSCVWRRWSLLFEVARSASIDERHGTYAL